MKRLNYQKIERIEWKVDVKIKSDKDTEQGEKEKPEAYVVLNIKTDEGNEFVYRLNPK